jgi:SAM-dependent methyltransferase
MLARAQRPLERTLDAGRRPGYEISPGRFHPTMQSEKSHYEREKTYWDERGSEDYATLSPFDRRRIADWVGWAGHGRILDVGGGAGMVSRLIKDQPETSVICVDISAEMLRHAPVSAVQADGMQLPFASDTFDMVVAAAFLHHLPGLESQVLAECHRVTVPGGRVIGYDPNGWSVQNRIFMGDGPLRLKRFTPDERPIVPRTIQRTAAELSFKSFEYELFTFRNQAKTPFEVVQTYIFDPVSRGPLKRYLERWFLWRAVK